MKIVIGIVVVFVAALGFWYFLSSGDVQVDQGLIEEPARTEKTPVKKSQVSDSAADSGDSAAKEEMSGNEDEEGNTDAPFPKDEELSNDQYAEDVEEDYGEEVSREDFADFISTALEEIVEEDEATSIAIVTEMGKIVDAQPTHKDEGLRFFRSCLENDKLSDKVKSQCKSELARRE